jgi:signal transduction histidine kinase
MPTRRSRTLPIVLAIVMMAIVAVLIVGWVLQAVLGAQSDIEPAGWRWALLAVGTSFLGLLLVGVILYLVLSVKAINLTRRQSSFIDSVTHELKSPIASLKLHLQTLARRAVDEDRRSAFYELMLEDLGRLDHLINQLLDAGRVEAGCDDHEEEEVHLPDLIRECAETARHRHGIPGDAVRLDLPPCAIRARRADLQLVFLNLMDNALKYAGDPPRVDVALVLASGGTAVASIADNGRGIPHGMRRRIFGRFVRLGSDQTREKGGTGLGLFIARTMARRLRGRIRVRDRQSGTGTTFEVELPGAWRPAPTDTVERPLELET